MRRIPAFDSANPLVEMNTTPLIDVLLVLLVMFIITIPIQTQAVKFDLPTGPMPPLPVKQINLLAISAEGTIRWNGTVVDRGQLGLELAATRQRAPTPELHIRPDPAARHGDVDEVLAMVKREQISRFGFVGNEAYENIF